MNDNQDISFLTPKELAEQDCIQNNDTTQTDLTAASLEMGGYKFSANGIETVRPIVSSINLTAKSDSKHAGLRYNEGKPIKSKTKIILFAGAIGSGKGYLLNKKIMELKETGNSILMLSFADPIKQIVKDLFGFDKNGKKTDNRVLSVPNYKDIVDAVLCLLEQYDVSMLHNPDLMTITSLEKYIDDIRISNGDTDKIKSALRGIMQIIGTEIGQTIKKEMWPIIAVNTIKTVLAAHNVDYVFIDDLRFLFEYLCVYREFQHDCDVEPFFVIADEVVRAKRRGITLEELKKQSKHLSERESMEVLLPFMRLYFPNNIIENN